MFRVILLVCAAHIHQSDCQINTALTVLQGPDASNEMACGLQSQAYFASTALAETLADDEYLKVTCIKSSADKRNVG